MSWKPRVDVGIFTQAKIPEGCDITQELLADLHNLTMCFGNESKQEKVKRFVFTARDTKLTVTVSTEKGNHCMVLILGDMMEPKPTIIDAGKGGDGEPCQIYMDHRITAANLEHVIVSADKQAEAKEGIKDGQRVCLNISEEVPKPQVNVVFAEPGACIPILPNQNEPPGQTMERAKQTILSFDQPGELRIMNHPMSGLSIIRASHVEYIKKREEAAHEVMKEQSIDPTKLGDLPQERVLALREQINQRMAKIREEFLAGKEVVLPMDGK